MVKLISYHLSPHYLLDDIPRPKRQLTEANIAGRCKGVFDTVLSRLCIRSEPCTLC